MIDDDASALSRFCLLDDVERFLIDANRDRTYFNRRRRLSFVLPDFFGLCLVSAANRNRNRIKI